ncbi:MAG: hypothetical protein LC687_06255 [Actinobacteria bacterium]|nr:hypothetical protein [Actinomycetota bacterium]
MYNVDEVLDMHGDTIRELRLGRRSLALWLNENVTGKYTEHFARRLLAEVEQEGESVTPREKPPETRSMEQILREEYGLHDPTWIPVSVWGDPRHPRAKWERRLDLLDAERMKRLMDQLGSEKLQVASESDSKNRRLGVMSIRDTHFGMFTDHPGPYKTYDLDEATYDLDEAQAAYVKAAGRLMANAELMSVDHLVIPFGSDALHVDGPQSTTTKGTPQEVSTSWLRAFEAALKSLNAVVEDARGRFERVTLVLEPGNHDHSLAQALGIAVKSRWEGQVEVLAGSETLKKVSLGNSHVFMHHGDSMKPAAYPGVIYSDYPECARKGSYIEVLSGHLHHRRRAVLIESGDYLEEHAIVHRITPALCPASNWAEAGGYRSEPGAQLTVYSEKGFVALFEWNARH